MREYDMSDMPDYEAQASELRSALLIAIRQRDDLLAACEAMRDYIVNEVFASGGEMVDQVKQADAAIARARGGE